MLKEQFKSLDFFFFFTFKLSKTKHNIMMWLLETRYWKFPSCNCLIKTKTHSSSTCSQITVCIFIIAQFMPAENMPHDFFLNTQFDFISNQTFVGQSPFSLWRARGYSAFLMPSYIRLAIYNSIAPRAALQTVEQAVEVVLQDGPRQISVNPGCRCLKKKLVFCSWRPCPVLVFRWNVPSVNFSLFWSLVQLPSADGYGGIR